MIKLQPCWSKMVKKKRIKELSCPVILCFSHNLDEPTHHMWVPPTSQPDCVGIPAFCSAYSQHQNIQSTLHFTSVSETCLHKSKIFRWNFKQNLFNGFKVICWMQSLRGFFFPCSLVGLNVWHQRRYFKANHWSVQLEPLFFSAPTHTCIHSLLHAVSVLQTLFKDAETEVIVTPVQRLCSFYFMWQFLVKLVKYMNPSRKNALSHSGLCFVCVKMIGNEVWGLFTFFFPLLSSRCLSRMLQTLGLSSWSPRRRLPGFQLGPLMKVDILSLTVL